MKSWHILLVSFIVMMGMVIGGIYMSYHSPVLTENRRIEEETGRNKKTTAAVMEKMNPSLQRIKAECIAMRIEVSRLAESIAKIEKHLEEKKTTPNKKKTKNNKKKKK